MLWRQREEKRNMKHGGRLQFPKQTASHLSTVLGIRASASLKSFFSDLKIKKIKNALIAGRHVSAGSENSAKNTHHTFFIVHTLYTVYSKIVDLSFRDARLCDEDALWISSSLFSFSRNKII